MQDLTEIVVPKLYREIMKSQERTCCLLETIYLRPCHHKVRVPESVAQRQCFGFNPFLRGGLGRGVNSGILGRQMVIYLVLLLRRRMPRGRHRLTGRASRRLTGEREREEEGGVGRGGGRGGRGGREGGGEPVGGREQIEGVWHL